MAIAKHAKDIVPVYNTVDVIVGELTIRIRELQYSHALQLQTDLANGAVIMDRLAYLLLHSAVDEHGKAIFSSEEEAQDCLNMLPQRHIEGFLIGISNVNGFEGKKKASQSKRRSTTK